LPLQAIRTTLSICTWRLAVVYISYLDMKNTKSELRLFWYVCWYTIWCNDYLVLGFLVSSGSLDFSSAFTGGKLVLDSWFLIASSSIPVPDDDFPSAIPANHPTSKFNKKSHTHTHTQKEATAHFTNKKNKREFQISVLKHYIKPEQDANICQIWFLFCVSIENILVMVCRC